MFARQPDAAESFQNGPSRGKRARAAMPAPTSKVKRARRILHEHTHSPRPDRHSGHAAPPSPTRHGPYRQVAQHAVCRAELHLPPDLHAGDAPQLAGDEGRHRPGVQYIILDNADGKPVGSVYYRDIDNHNRSAEYGIFIGEESARGKGLAPRRPACSPILALRGCTCTVSACACWPKMPPPAAAMRRPALCRRVFSAIWSCWTEPTATSSLWPSWRRTDVKRPMQKIRTCLQKTPNALLCAWGSRVPCGLLLLCYRTPLNEVWLPTTMNNDEALYNRQVVSVLTHGGPQGTSAIRNPPRILAATVPGARC